MASKAYIGTANQYIYHCTRFSNTYALAYHHSALSIPANHCQGPRPCHKPQNTISELMSSNVIYSRQNSTQAVTGVVKYHNIPKRQAREELPNHVNTYKTYIGVMWHEPILVSPTFNKITSKITSNAEIIRPTGVSICYASTSDILSAKYPNTR